MKRARRSPKVTRWLKDCLACNDADPDWHGVFCDECLALIPDEMRQKLAVKLFTRRPFSNRVKILLQKTVRGIAAARSKMEELSAVPKQPESGAVVRTPESGGKTGSDA